MASTYILNLIPRTLDYIQSLPLHIILLAFVTLFALGFGALYLVIFFSASLPRPPTIPERAYRTVNADGSISDALPLPCWTDAWARAPDGQVEPPEVFMSVVVPAYNEEERLPGMLEEAVDFLEEHYGYGHKTEQKNISQNGNGELRQRGTAQQTNSPKGWEIIIVSDGSSDNTVKTALSFAKNHIISQSPAPVPGPRTPHPNHSTHISAGSIRVVELETNRGKGGAVTHGMRHVRGKYAIFADADGASRFSDLAHMVRKAEELESNDPQGRAVVIGSRAHLVDSDVVVKRSAIRNALMYTFHLFIRTLTTTKTSQIGDTQCGFKLFTRASLPYIIPHMHTEGWIFDVEMLMLAEAAGIPMAEVPVGWKEVQGSKMNLVSASIGMAWGLAVIRGAWGMGIWSQR